MKIGKYKLSDWEFLPTSIGRFLLNYKDAVCIELRPVLHNDGYYHVWVPEFYYNLSFLLPMFKEQYSWSLDCDLEQAKNVVDNFLIRVDKLLIFA